jgi:hypothetical protein
MFTGLISHAALAIAAAKGVVNAPDLTGKQDTKQGEPTVAGQGPRVNPSYFNPQMAIVGSFAAELRDHDGKKAGADFREIEFGFAGDVDPFLKVVAIASLSKDENGDSVFELEEGFGQYTRLGKGFTAKIGKIAAAIGRVQRNHTDQLDYLDFPLVIQDTLGEEGFRQPGGSISYLFPGDRFSELTVEALDPSKDAPLFNKSDVNAPAFVGHYRTFFDFSEDLSGQLGASFANGPSVGSDKRGDMYGLDYTMKWHPGQKGKSANFESEVYWSKPGGFSKRTVGAFARFAYEFRPLWFVTVGADYSEIPGTTNLHRSVLSGLTFKLTEFEHWRLEFQHITGNFEPTKDLLTLEFQWLIVTHPAHKY